MAQFVQPVGNAPANYRGIENIFQYTNWDGELARWNCGQAAAATYLTFLGILEPNEERAPEIMRQLEKEYPPDVVGGWFGTSRRQVEQICRSRGRPLDEIQDEESLREHLSRNVPVVVMLGVPGPKILGRFTVPAGHWMVAYGFDDEHIYLTNMGRMSWPEFRSGWNSLVPRLISMRYRGLKAADV